MQNIDGYFLYSGSIEICQVEILDVKDSEQTFQLRGGVGGPPIKVPNRPTPPTITFRCIKNLPSLQNGNHHLTDKGEHDIPISITSIDGDTATALVG